MKQWLKENLVLAIGLTLPLLLIVLFFLATVLPKSLGTPPRYDLLFTATVYDYQKNPEYQLKYRVKDGHVVLKTRKIDDKNGVYSNPVKLMVYDINAESLREIKPNESTFSDGAETVVEETRNWTLEANMTAPDGYQLEGPTYDKSGLLGGLFGGGYRGGWYRVKKGAVAYKVPQNQPDYYYNQMQFLGWVLKK